MAEREVILSSYTQAYQASLDNPSRTRPLTPAEFMLRSRPGPHKVEYRGQVFYSEYSNRESAARAFRKIRSGETSGERMVAQAEMYPHRAPGQERGFILGKPSGGYQQGYWKAVVHMNWVDENNNLHEDEERSFIVYSSKYNSYFDAPLVEEELGDAIDDHVSAWEDDYGVSNVEVMYVEVIRIQTTTKQEQYIVDLG